MRHQSYTPPQAHVCISSTSRAGAELGYDVSVISDGIGDRDIPGASAKQLVDVSLASSYNLLTLYTASANSKHGKTTLAELGDVSATIVYSKDL